MARILFADDDPELRSMLGEYLMTEGFEVVTACNGQEAQEKSVHQNVDLIVLDVMMPGKNGFEVLREIRRGSTVPVLMLTALGDDASSIFGFDEGADDYLSKPCNPKVLTARIRALLRRGQTRGEAQTVNVGDLVLHPGTRTVVCNGRNLSLTSTEFSLLEVLLRDAGKVVARDDLCEKVLGRKLGRLERTLDMHISRLRQKLGPARDGSERIKTIWGLGYQYTA